MILNQSSIFPNTDIQSVLQTQFTYTYLVPKALIVLGIIYLLAYFGFGALNLWGHDAEGPINNLWINLIALWEGNPKTIMKRVLDEILQIFRNKHKRYCTRNKKLSFRKSHLIEQGQGSWRLATDWLLENFSHIKDIFEWDIEFAGIFVSQK